MAGASSLIPPPLPVHVPLPRRSQAVPAPSLAGAPRERHSPTAAPSLELERDGATPLPLVVVRRASLVVPMFTAADTGVLARCYREARGDMVGYLSSPEVVHMVDVQGYSIRDLMVLHPVIRGSYRPE